MALVVSCLAEGLLLVDGDRVERLDDVPSAGLAAGPLGCARALHEPAETAVAGEVLLGGRTLAVAGLRDPHELDWDGSRLACVATLANAVLWVGRGGRVERAWRATGEGDCWHLSGVSTAGGRTLVTSFGRFARHRDWAEARREGAGFVLDVGAGRVVLGDLSSPHSPRVLGGRLAVCDSGRGDVLVGGRRRHLGGWTRGLAMTSRGLVVGVSAPRGGEGGAHLAVLRPHDLALLDRIPLPVREVFDIVELDAESARRLARARPAPEPTEPLRPRDLRARIESPRGLRLRAGRPADVRVTVTNLGGAPLRSEPPHPVSVVAGWASGDRALWSPLPGPLAPRASAELPARVLAPTGRGAHLLELRLVQEGVAWLDGVARAEVTVG